MEDEAAKVFDDVYKWNEKKAIWGIAKISLEKNEQICFAKENARKRKHLRKKEKEFRTIQESLQKLEDDLRKTAIALAERMEKLRTGGTIS